MILYLVFVSSVHTDNHYEDYEVTDSLVLNAKFAEILHRRLNPAEYNDAVLSGQTETIDLLSSDEEDCKNDVGNIFKNDNNSDDSDSDNRKASTSDEELPDITFFQFIVSLQTIDSWISTLICF